MVVAIACAVIFVLLPLLAGDRIDVPSVIGAAVATLVTFVAMFALEK